MDATLIQAGGFVLLLLLGYGFGRVAETRHLRDLVAREKRANRLPAIASRFPPEDARYDQRLVSGSVVIASDYFKRFLAGMINLFGGRITPFEAMLDRARREALLRMKADAHEAGARYVFNVKFQTTVVGIAAMEVFAYGTALVPLEAPRQGGPDGATRPPRAPGDTPEVRQVPDGAPTRFG